MPIKRQQPGCCCGCPPGVTRETLGIPDTLQIDFSSPVGTADGMPVDSVIGSCGANDIHTRWTQSDALINLLSSFKFDYDAPGSSGCCFKFKSRGTVQPCSDDPGDYVLLGASPFSAKAIGATTGIAIPRDNLFSTPFPGDGCCGNPSEVPCSAACGHGVDWTDGTGQIPGGVFAIATLKICISGSVVTITVVVDLVITYDSIAGSCSYVLGGINSPSCEPIPPSTVCGDGTTTCEGISTSITLSATQDLTGVSGANIWEKIKAASWSSDFGYAVCDAGGGCTGHNVTRTFDCGLNYACDCATFGSDEFVATDDYPVDQQCIYSTGTVGLAFSDAA